MRKQFHWRATSSNLGYLRDFAEAQGSTVNGSLNSIVALLREHGIASIGELMRVLPAKKDGTKMVSNR